MASSPLGGAAATLATAAGGRLFLGLDSSTQGLKATALDEQLKIVGTFAVNYQRDLSHYGTTNGVHAKEGAVVTQPTLMYFEALDLLLGQMREKGFEFGRVAAVSGSGQQHGSVYWRKGAASLLAALKPGAPLAAQLRDGGAFRIPDSPIWMDSSTGAQCAALEKAAGGAQAVASISGSRAYERFTGNQIAKIAAQQPAAYAETERISLISSAMASVLAGAYAPIDTSDGSGMNLLDVRGKNWHPTLVDATAPGLVAKLGAQPAPAHAVVGPISPYFSATYGVPGSAKVIAWSGDNPCSVAGLGLRAPGDVAVSLGTSDTVFGITADPAPGLEGHIFANPVDPKSYMAMLCYKNGSLTRERVRDSSASGTWDAFNAALASTAPGNGGFLGFFIDAPEITPGIAKAGIRRFAPGGARIASFPSPAQEVRAVVEGQFLSMRAHGESVGLTSPKRIIATGGASNNRAVLQVLADVFGCDVHVAAQSDSASLGAAYRALHGWTCDARGAFVPFEEVTGSVVSASLTLAATPRREAHAAYTALLPAFRAAEAQVVAEA